MKARQRMKEGKRVSGPMQAGTIAPHSRKGRTVRPAATVKSGAGSNPAPSSTSSRTNSEVAPQRQPVAPADGPRFDSHWEAEYAGQLELEKRLGTVKAFWYHPSTFHLPGGVKYTPDFLVQYPDGMERKLKIVEIKGWSRNRRDGVTRYKIAAGVFECFDWAMVEKQRGSWVTIG